MPKSGLIQATKNAYMRGFNDGQQEGQQQMLDVVMIWLHRQGFGTTRLVRFFEENHKIMEEYAGAFHVGMEQDVLQERMDAELRDGLRDKPDLFVPFAARHPQVAQAGYKKMPRGKNGR